MAGAGANSTRRHASRLAFCALGWLVVTAAPAGAEYCWIYDDSQAYTKLACPGDPIPSSQTVRQKHIDWHACFGSVGEPEGPTHRGQRFLAFHRQLIEEFNLDREESGLDKIETWDASQGLRITLPYPACTDGVSRECDNNDDGDCTDAVDDEVLCDLCQDLPACLTINDDNTTPCPPFPYTSLDQFQNADEIGIALDTGGTAWHASFHTGVSSADGDGTQATAIKHATTSTARKSGPRA